MTVFSDSHGNTGAMLRAVRAASPDLVLHLGDYTRDAQTLREAFPGLDVRGVRGNCYTGSAEPDKLTFTLEGVTVFMTHGHNYAVKFTRVPLANAARFSGAQLALYGHTHQAECTQMGAITVVNPGTAGMGGERSYAEITLEGGRFECRIKPL